MGVLTSAERNTWQLLTGSSHMNYRQALWRPTRQPLEKVAGWSDEFGGDLTVGGINRRAWHKVGVLAVREHKLEELLGQSGADPAVAFKMGEMLVVGKLEHASDFGWVGTQEQSMRGHGFRIGPDKAQFSLGIVTTEGTFVAPHQDYMTSQGPIEAHVNVGDIGSGYEHLYFS